MARVTEVAVPVGAQARLSSSALPDPGRLIPPWPGTSIPVGGGEVFLRSTPFAGADGLAAERALYVHGLGGASTNWTDLAALLAVRFEGYALDLPGFGHTAPRGGYSLRSHIRAVVGVLEELAGRPGPGQGQPLHLLGNSLGGLVSLVVAARRPDLVATLTLISPAMPVYQLPAGFGRAIPLVFLPGIPALFERRIAAIPAEQRVRGLLQTCIGDPDAVPPERVAEAIAELEEYQTQPWAGQALVRSFRGLISSYLRLGPGNAWRLARSVRAPSLVVWGDRDRLVDPQLAPRLAAALPDARLQVQPGVGHLAMLENPEVTARAVLALAEDAVR